MRKIIYSSLLLVFSLGLVGGKCQKPNNQEPEVVVKKEYSSSTALEVMKKTSNDLGWHEPWHRQVNAGWAEGGEKWGVHSEDVLKGDGMYYYHGANQSKWNELKANHCTSNNWIQTKFGKTCCNDRSTLNAAEGDWHLVVFPETLWAASFNGHDNNKQCSKSIEILNVFFDNLKDAE